MKRILTLLFIGWCAVTYAQSTIPVTFNVNMAVQQAESNFNPATDSILIKGDFQITVGPDTTNWSGTTFRALDDDGDLIYNLTINFPDTSNENVYNYKFVIRNQGNDSFEGDPQRSLTVTAPSMDLPVVYFGRDSIVTNYVQNTVNFTADLSDIYGTGLGFLDPATDSILVQGLTWNGSVRLLSGQRKMVEDPFSPAIYTASLTIRGIEGDSAEWKCTAFPADHFFNTGWEVENNRKYYIGADGGSFDAPVFKPSVFPIKDSLTTDVSILFQVDITNAYNRYDDSKIDLSKVQFVGIKGQNTVLGAWAGAWVPADTVSTTATRTMWALNDSGLEGDKIANDNIWSRTILFPAPNIGGPTLYKYGIYYDGVADVSGGATSPMNNEFDSGDHFTNVYASEEVIEVLNVFGTYSPVISSVKQIDAELPASITLEQNYPNPFNPETTIRYAVPKSGMVELAIFNILGQKVAQLLNQEQTAGSYEVKFNASKFSSGIYFYRLSGSGMTQTKKMMLIK